jgi:mono/diheme cytochrome c family protein
MRQAFILALILFIAVLAIAQIKPQVQVVPAPYTPSDSGKAMFDAYCGSCHGVDGKGHGPAAPAMKSAVPDLTQLSKSHGGTYPAFSVTETLRLTRPLSAHGSNDMPVWGPVFSHLSRQDNAVIQQRIHNLNMYIESLQVK